MLLKFVGRVPELAEAGWLILRPGISDMLTILLDGIVVAVDGSGVGVAGSGARRGM